MATAIPHGHCCTFTQSPRPPALCSPAPGPRPAGSPSPPQPRSQAAPHGWCLPSTTGSSVTTSACKQRAAKAPTAARQREGQPLTPAGPQGSARLPAPRPCPPEPPLRGLRPVRRREPGPPGPAYLVERGARVRTRAHRRHRLAAVGAGGRAGGRAAQQPPEAQQPRRAQQHGGRAKPSCPSPAAPPPLPPSQPMGRAGPRAAGPGRAGAARPCPRPAEPVRGGAGVAVADPAGPIPPVTVRIKLVKRTRLSPYSTAQLRAPFTPRGPRGEVILNNAPFGRTFRAGLHASCIPGKPLPF